MAAQSPPVGTPAGAVPGVSAEDLVAAVRVHLDRVHDAVRRLGCEPGAAVEVVEASAVDLVEVVAARPETVEDAVGWWFARARALGRRVATRADLPLGGGVLSVDQDQQVLAEALDQLPERERVALLLRDSYDLPATSVGSALGTDADGAMELVGRARLAFLPLVDVEAALVVPSHQGDLGALARLGEATSPAARDATARRHALSCDQCRAITDGQQRAHLLLTGLTVAALPEADRAGVLDRVEEVAYGLLPSSADLLLAGHEDEGWEEEDDEPPRLFSPLLALLALVVAGLAGIGIGLLVAHDGGPDSLAGADGSLPPGLRLASPQPPPKGSQASPATVQQTRPDTTVFVIPPSPSPEPVPAPVVTTPAEASEPLSLSLSPAVGPNGTALTVNGAGFAPDSEVRVDYLDSAGTPTGSQAVVVTDARGRFTAELAAQDPSNVPGAHEVVATDGAQTARATFTATP